MSEQFFLGVDGGGTQCRARLERADGTVLGRGQAGPATTRIGIDVALLSIMAAARGALHDAGFGEEKLKDIHAGIGLAGMGRRGVSGFLEHWPHPFASVTFEGDGYLACLGAYKGKDGGIVIIGTGSIGFALLRGERVRVGGYGFPVSDEGSGADLGLNAVRSALCAIDGRIGTTPLLSEVLGRFSNNPYAVVDWMDTASATDYATLAPLVVRHAEMGDVVAIGLMQNAGVQIGLIIGGLHKKGVKDVALIGGLAGAVEKYVPASLAAQLVKPLADAVAGGILLAKQHVHN